MDQALPQLLNEQQTARILNVSVAALRRWRREGRGPDFTRCERCVRYSSADIAQFIRASRRQLNYSVSAAQGTRTNE